MYKVWNKLHVLLISLIWPLWAVESMGSCKTWHYIMKVLKLLWNTIAVCARLPISTTISPSIFDQWHRVAMCACTLMLSLFDWWQHVCCDQFFSCLMGMLVALKCIQWWVSWIGIHFKMRNQCPYVLYKNVVGNMDVHGN